MKAKNALSLALAAGIASTASAANTPIGMEATPGNTWYAAHIYFNVATGEKISTLINNGENQAPAVGNEGSEIWIADTGDQCSVVGLTSEFIFAVDSQVTLGAPINNLLLDWGDIAMDTVVDCVQVNWWSSIADTDTDNDGNADGVPGFGMNWTYWDAFDGNDTDILDCTALPLVGFTFFTLPANDPSVPAGFVATYTLDVDLAGTFGTSLTFEIGDTDSDPQSAAVHNAGLSTMDQNSDSIFDIDPDQDGLADWGWSVQVFQPGSIDIDNADSDSDSQTGVDGDSTLQEDAGVLFGSPTPGHAEPDTQGKWDWVSDGPTAGATEDIFLVGTTANPDGSGDLNVDGPFIFIDVNDGNSQGFDCDPVGAGYIPAAHFQTILYFGEGTDPGCPADLAGNPDGTPDGLLNFTDVSAYLALFAAANPAADLAGNPDGTPDGLLNFTDVSAYLALFAAGCP